ATDCGLAESSAGPWRSAAELIPHLSSGSGRAAAGSFAATSHADGPNTAASSSASPAAGSPDRPVEGSGYVAPHRGALVLVLGLLGVCSCPLFSFVAWGLGSHDLRE